MCRPNRQGDGDGDGVGLFVAVACIRLGPVAYPSPSMKGEKSGVQAGCPERTGGRAETEREDGNVPFWLWADGSWESCPSFFFP